MLIIKAHGGLEITTVTLYGTTMILLYTISCIYHSLSPRITGKKVMRVLDHCNVFLLVFGTIIPIALVGIGGYLGWIYFGISASITVIGITFSDFSNKGKNGVKLIIAGGLIYSNGTILYVLGSKKKYIHSVFHFFCIAASICHYFAIYLFVLR